MSSKTLLGFVAGAAVGALAGILLAPDKGSETRKKIGDKTTDLTDSVKSSFGDFIDQVKNMYANASGTAADLEGDVKAKMSNLKSEARNVSENSFS